MVGLLVGWDGSLDGWSVGWLGGMVPSMVGLLVGWDGSKVGSLGSQRFV